MVIDSLTTKFNDYRRQVLQRLRDRKVLAVDVTSMRKKMVEHLLTVNEKQFDLKQSPGGIVDIEFLAQYLVLAYSNNHEILAKWSDNINIFTELAELTIIDPKLAINLINSYEFFRNLTHIRSLLGLNNKINKTEEVEYYSQVVQEAYQKFLNVSTCL